MTELSDADLEMAAEIQAAFSGISKERALAVLRTEFNPSAMLTAARTLVTAEILASARITEDEMVEAMARAIAGRGWDDLYEGAQAPSRRLARTALTAIEPELARLAAENARVAAVVAERDAAIAERDRLRDALTELLEVASLRGDDDLPHPADDPKLWTARMQMAWDEARAALTPEAKP